MDRRTPGYGRLSAKGNLRQVELQISIVNVNYRLAPEYPYPTPLNDCYSAHKWPEVLRADLKKGFLIEGLSAGAHLATILAHRARDDPFFKVENSLARLFKSRPFRTQRRSRKNISLFFYPTSRIRTRRS
ncbi:hypothetical protein C8F04DRAFT_687913 [Mycena alexandri]|uniref:Alpha/beta hydrolase fold-3 domain-containing protein n=1 Tax=Mycena alexandri TaxID=1745969 RepID=A0AAD6THK0_9AGAR|nr:hypothetical protein C8F04DRAFT_687913 [Mycena alexandri]